MTAESELSSGPGASRGAWARAENLALAYLRSAALFGLGPVEPGGLELRLMSELIFKSSLQVDDFISFYCLSPVILDGPLCKLKWWYQYLISDSLAPTGLFF